MFNLFLTNGLKAEEGSGRRVLPIPVVSESDAFKSQGVSERQAASPKTQKRTADKARIFLG